MNLSFLEYDPGYVWFNADLLTDDSERSRFTSNTSFSMIVEQMMIERWNSSYSFEHYYHACAPIYCSYSVTERTKTFLGVIITLISIIGGLTIVLRLITAQLVELVFKVLERKVKNQQQDRVHLLDRIKINLRTLITFLFTTLMNMNMFPLRTFSSHIERTKAKYLGQLATRLYILLLIISFVILTIYTIIQPRILTKTYDKPSLNMYHRLLLNHEDTLQCPCSSISSTYDQFITIEPIFHQVCSSSFVADQWRMNVTAKLVLDLSIYSNKDYRRFLSAHLQLLKGLCELANQSMDDSINQFLSSFFVTIQLQSPTNFQDRINLIIEQSKSNALKTFTRLLSLLRAANHGNAIITAYGTNFEYIPSWYDSDVSTLITQPIIYDNNCSCALNASCTTQAVFIKSDLSLTVSINGFKMGCTPSESFLASTLECFYDSTCINLVQEYTSSFNNIDAKADPLVISPNSSQFLANTTIKDLVGVLFIEKWSTRINHAAYFKQCLPTSCSYNYIQKFSSIYMVTLLLGLYGGLSFVLKWICPTILSLVYKLYRLYKTRKNVIAPTLAIDIPAMNSTHEGSAIRHVGHWYLLCSIYSFLL
ncbi:hypothetical protein I4U23_023372 [Adineta vaga]|nr:hypothetical protein I4U23_023372 [Adineta vaga]